MPLLRRGDWLQFQNHGAYTMSLSSAFNGFATSKAPTFYVCSRKPVAEDGGPAEVVLSADTARGGEMWAAPSEELCLEAAPEHLGIHCQS